MTFDATVNPISYEGGKQVFIDSERETWNMDPDALEEGFKQHPEAKVAMLAHLYGTPSKMDEIKVVCKKHGAILIENAAEALAATYKGRPCGTFGNLAALSLVGVMKGIGSVALFLGCFIRDIWAYCTKITVSRTGSALQTA